MDPFFGLHHRYHFTGVFSRASSPLAPIARTRKYPIPTQPTIANAFAVRNKVISPTGPAVIHTKNPSKSSDTSVPPVVRTPVPIFNLDSALSCSLFSVIEERIADNIQIYMAADPTADSDIEVSNETISIITATMSKPL